MNNEETRVTKDTRMNQKARAVSKLEGTTRADGKTLGNPWFMNNGNNSGNTCALVFERACRCMCFQRGQRSETCKHRALFEQLSF